MYYSLQAPHHDVRAFMKPWRTGAHSWTTSLLLEPHPFHSSPRHKQRTIQPPLVSTTPSAAFMCRVHIGGAAWGRAEQSQSLLGLACVSRTAWTPAELTVIDSSSKPVPVQGFGSFAFLLSHIRAAPACGGLFGSWVNQVIVAWHEHCPSQSHGFMAASDASVPTLI